MGGGFHFLVEIELKMAKMPAFTNLKRVDKNRYLKMVVIIDYEFQD